MLIRIVRLTIRPNSLANFLAMYAEVETKIRAMPGCQHLELWQDARFSNIVTSCSHWKSDRALEAYRESELFRNTWARVKPLFAAPALAHSYMPHPTLNNFRAH